MTDHATQRAIIEATPEECFAVAADFARYPEWATDIKHAAVQAFDDDGRGGDVTFRAAAMGRSTTYTLRYYYGSNPLRIAWKQLEGDITRKLDGEYEFLATDETGTQTEVAYHLEADLVVPIPGFVKRRAETRIIRTALEDLRRRVEATVSS